MTYNKEYLRIKQLQDKKTKEKKLETLKELHKYFIEILKNNGDKNDK